MSIIVIDFICPSIFWISVANAPTVFSGLSRNIPVLVGSGRTTLGGTDLVISTVAKLAAYRHIAYNIISCKKVKQQNQYSRPTFAQYNPIKILY